MAKQIIFDFHSASAHLGEEKTPLSRAALGALSGASKENIRAFAHTWSGLSNQRRQDATQMLVHLAEDNFEYDFNAIFRHLLDDPDARVRESAIEGLWEDQDPTLVKSFVGFLRSDPNARVRATAADALGRFLLLAEYGRLPESYGAIAYEALLATVQSRIEESTVLYRSIEALGFSSQPLVRDVIRVAYDDPDEYMRASALVAMGHSADTSWRKTVEDELESPDAQMRFNAARAAGELEDRNAVPRLIELLDDADREVQAAAVGSLAQIASKPAQRALALAAESEDEILSELARDALRELDFTSSDFLMLDLDAEDELDEEIEEEEE
ncbi:MAG: HEAT repeat domain-containing protein [Chloroflexi bacterium]|nr:HEAT repeat domain-containing protein [Chloroflexota bacterium]